MKIMRSIFYVLSIENPTQYVF